MTTKTYKTEDIFVDIPNDPDNIYINIPDEIISELGWSETDTINIQINDNAIILERIENGE